MLVRCNIGRLKTLYRVSVRINTPPKIYPQLGGRPSKIAGGIPKLGGLKSNWGDDTPLETMSSLMSDLHSQGYKLLGFSMFGRLDS